MHESCAEGWAPREQVFSPHRILDQFRWLRRAAAVAPMMARKGGNCGFFEAESTKNVALIERKNHKEGGFLEMVVVVAELSPGPVGARGGREV
ncbi:hypothetical protein PVK06_008147 [Gossypium arboreum]|uniref:Uncharacterized protein n=1 Tax=Gossypium arboreum TaxID=29729 RepID=A0ABR0QJE0_GOSAR|nr:hypothetical protein PVK06_008147 [Gossypium arboreum]